MTSDNRLDDSLRRKTISRLEAVQSQAEGAQWLQEQRQWLWNQFQTSDAAIRKVTQGYHRVATPHRIVTFH
ncbi:hypothetical protein TNCV_3320291 [Trichonephila clavipes]|nr:hypothetical protein TNCV_3320291 [Trichonephila clavipes]